MAGSQRGQAIPTQLSLAQFEAFVLPHLSRGSRGPAPKLGLHKIFNYILRLLYMGCQWKEPECGRLGGAERQSGIDCAVGDFGSSAFQALTVAAGVPIPGQSFDDVDLRDKAEVPLRGVDA